MGRVSFFSQKQFIEIFFLTVVATLPFQVALSPFSGADVLLARALVPVLFLAWIVKRKKRLPVLTKDPIVLLLVMVVVVAAVSLINAENISWGVRKLFVFVSLFPFYVVAKDMLKTSHMRYKALRVLFFSTLATAVIGILQFAGQFVFGVSGVEAVMEWVAPVLYGGEAGTEILAHKSWFVHIGGETYFRAFSFFETPQLFAMFLGMTTLLAFGQFLSGKDRAIGSQRFLFSVFSIGLLGVVFSFSRGAYLASFIAVSGTMGLALFTKASIHRVGAGMIVFILFLVLTTGVLGGNTFSERLGDTINVEEGSNKGRLSMWKISIEVFRENPILGVGLGQFPLEVDPRTYYRAPINAHNTYFEVAAEQGVLGLVAWLGVGFFALFGLLRYVYKLSKNNEKKEVFFAVGVIGSLVYFFLHSFFETIIYSPSILLTYLFLLAIAHRITKTPSTQSRNQT